MQPGQDGEVQVRRFQLHDLSRQRGEEIQEEYSATQPQDQRQPGRDETGLTPANEGRQASGATARGWPVGLAVRNAPALRPSPSLLSGRPLPARGDRGRRSILTTGGWCWDQAQGRCQGGDCLHSRTVIRVAAPGREKAPRGSPPGAPSLAGTLALACLQFLMEHRRPRQQTCQNSDPSLEYHGVGLCRPTPGN